jgi:translation elongation factor EF-G
MVRSPSVKLEVEKTMSGRFPLADIRNMAFIAHIDAGKTTVTEKILVLLSRQPPPPATGETAG